MKQLLTPSQLNTWRLFITLHARLVGQIDKGLIQANQTPLNWYDVLIELYEAPQHRLRMRDLADKVVLTRSGLTRLVDRLEEQGYLRRELDAQDKRGFYAILTDAGINALRAAWPVYAEGILRLFAQHLSEDEAQTLSHIFTRLLEAQDEPKT